MREAEIHVPHGAVETLGFDVSGEDFEGVDVRDVTMVSCRVRESVVAITYSGPAGAALADADAVEWWERVDEGGADATYLCKVVAPDVFGETPGSRDRHLDVQRVAVEDGGCTLTLVGSQDALQCDSEFGEGLDASLSLRRLTDYEGPRDELDSLTSRQREVLETAHELGYYEVPRETTADDVARRLDLDRSTVTEHLQRAERNLLAAVLSG